jgi:basic membrane protein A and related proteins
MPNARSLPISEHLTDTLIERIRADYYPLDVHFPSESELCKEFKVSRATVRTALAALVAKGLLFKRAGIGSFLVPEARSILNVPPKIDFKVAMLMSGLMTDGGWNTQAYNGLDRLKSEGFQVAFSEMVTPFDFDKAIRQFAGDGIDLVIGHGWEFGESINQLAENYPQTKFFVTADWMSENIPPNTQFFHPPSRYSGYMAGALAALVSKTHVIGFVGGFDNPIQRSLGVAFQQAAQDAVPGTNALINITGDFNDVRKGRLAAASLIKNGADVVWHSADLTGLGAISGAVEGGAKVIGCYSDQTSMAYSSFLSSIYWDLEYVICNRAYAALDGSFEGGTNWEPTFSDIYYFSAGGKDTPFVNINVPMKVQFQMQDILNRLKDGSIKVVQDDLADMAGVRL